MKTETFERILKFAFDHEASDIHFQVSSPPTVRKDGELLPLKHPSLTAADTESIAQLLIRSDDAQVLRSVRDYDGTFTLGGVGRFRVNVFRQKGQYAAVLRLIPLEVLDFTALSLPPVLERIANLRRGLVFVTGATGNGKSTTIAAMIQQINKTRRAHIVTIEDPIEFVFENETAIISQREVSADTDSFGVALRAALRQDPDIIQVGELRDHETTDICLKAAETGHMVMSAIHTPDVAKTIGRVLSYFPSSEQTTVRQRLADNLMAIISLRLLPKKDGTGRIPACEIMLTSRTIGECILTPEKTHEIEEHMAKNREFGMQTFNQHLTELVQAGLISLDHAKLASSRPEELERALVVD